MPETAKGFVFHTLEDYNGLVNVITRPQLVPRFRRLIEGRLPSALNHHRPRHMRRGMRPLP